MVEDDKLRKEAREFVDGFLESLANDSGLKSDEDIDNYVMHFLPEKPTQDKVVLKISNHLVDNILLYLEIASRAYPTVLKIKEKYDALNVRNENIDSLSTDCLTAFLGLEKAIRELNSLFLGTEGYEVYHNLSQMKIPPDQIALALESDKTLVESDKENDIYHDIVTPQVFNSICCAEKVGYGFVKAHGILEKSPFIAIGLDALHSALPTARAIVNDPLLYDCLTERVQKSQ